MTTTESQLVEVLRERAALAPPRPDRYREIRHRIRAHQRRRVLATGTAVAATITASLAIGLNLARPTSPVGTGDENPPTVSSGPTLPPAPFDSSQSIATLSGTDHHWMNGSHTFTIAAGGTLSITAECYGTGTLSVTIGVNTPPLINTPCANSATPRTLLIATIPPNEYARYGIQPGSAVTITVTRTDGSSDQWRVQVQRDPAMSAAQSSR